MWTLSRTVWLKHSSSWWKLRNVSSVQKKWPGQKMRKTSCMRAMRSLFCDWDWSSMTLSLRTTRRHSRVLWLQYLKRRHRTDAGRKWLWISDQYGGPQGAERSMIPYSRLSWSNEWRMQMNRRIKQTICLPPWRKRCAEWANKCRKTCSEWSEIWESVTHQTLTYAESMLSSTIKLFPPDSKSLPDSISVLRSASIYWVGLWITTQSKG